MSAVISGTNGLLQSYDYQVLTTGFSYTFAAGTQVLVINPAGTLATGTITMPAAPADGMTITFSSSQQITALTLNGNTGQTVVGAVTFLPTKTGATYVYRTTGASWYPTATVPGTGSQLVQGTAVASTSGTSIDITGIPNWVKRVTVMLNGVSTNGTSNYLIQIGSGSVTTTGYTATSQQGGTSATSTAGFIVTQGIAAARFNYGLTTISALGSFTYIASGTLADYTAACAVSGGGVTLSGALDRVRITTVNGTDTFDAGSINILYE